MRLIDDVEKGPVALDTAAFIYFIEAHPVYLPPLRPLFVPSLSGLRVLQVGDYT